MYSKVITIIMDHIALGDCKNCGNYIKYALQSSAF